MPLVQENVSLKPYNSFGIPVNARFFVDVDTEDGLQDLLSSGQAENQELLVLGGGSNILFTKDFFSIGSDGVPTVRTIYEAYYQLDFAKLTAVRVPEPSSMLLFIGGVALFLSRRLRKE